MVSAVVVSMISEVVDSIEVVVSSGAVVSAGVVSVSVVVVSVVVVVVVVVGIGVVFVYNEIFEE